MLLFMKICSLLRCKKSITTLHECSYSKGRYHMIHTCVLIECNSNCVAFCFYVKKVKQTVLRLRGYFRTQRTNSTLLGGFKAKRSKKTL